ncbi:hypothetical protein AXG93_2584s1450 [Marchantia polymorpha subsp. ruderalis]|uniref:Uncharacterized protein n=1 Tax=Marchantia polymorpha subsp. ruderalis TaxID=1480154 RepID=A0A176VIB8_MARPO|nr:hypothetical protein AXG93_2584s1450 [Marchantia polymorpha subsp. ruderalis]
MEIVKERSRSSSSMLLFIWVPLEVVVLLLCLAAPTTSLPYIGKALEPEGAPEGEAQRLQQEQPFPIDNESLFVDISNNMEAGDSNSVISVDCVAESSTREPLDFLGHGSVKPSQAVIYYMNLRVFTPDIVSCTFEWSGKKKTLDMYDNRNLELQYKASTEH